MDRGYMEKKAEDEELEKVIRRRQADQDTELEKLGERRPRPAADPEKLVKASEAKNRFNFNPRKQRPWKSYPAVQPASAKDLETFPTRDPQKYRLAKRGPEYEGEDVAALKTTGGWERPGPTEKDVKEGITGVRTKMMESPERDAKRISPGGEASKKFGTQKLHRQGGTPFDTTGAKGGSFTGSASKHEIFAMAPGGEMYSTDPVPGREGDTKLMTHHSSFTGGKELVGAGEIQAEQGVVKQITDLSGHYKPRPEHTADVVNELERQKVAMIDEQAGNKRATVKLSYNEQGQFTQDENSKFKMDFERFSQTGGNLAQIAQKRKVVQDIDSKGTDQPRHVLAGLRAEREQSRQQQAEQQRKQEEEASKKGLTPELRKKAEDAGWEWNATYEKWEKRGSQDKTDAELAQYMRSKK